RDHEVAVGGRRAGCASALAVVLAATPRARPADTAPAGVGDANSVDVGKLRVNEVPRSELDVVAAAQRDVSLAPDPDHRLRSALAPGQALDIPMADRSAAQAAAAGRPWWIRVGSAGSPCQIVAGDRIAESGEHQLRPDSGPYPVAFDGHVA